MYLADTHVHSALSPDGSVPMEKLAEAAVRQGLSELCFTDHVEPLVFGRTDLRGPYDWAAWRSAYERAQAAWGGRITLGLGMELGDPVWAPEHCAALLEGAPEMDFILGSIHTCSPESGGEDLYYVNPSNEREALSCIADYLLQLQRLAALGGFDAAAHLTLPLRYLNEGRGFHVSFEPFEEELRAILKTFVEKGIGLELNTNRGHTPLPEGRWLRLYRELGGEVVTIGTDAHDLRYLGCAIREAQALLKACGFRYFCTFRKRKPVWHEL